MPRARGSKANAGKKYQPHPLSSRKSESPRASEDQIGGTPPSLNIHYSKHLLDLPSSLSLTSHIQTHPSKPGRIFFSDWPQRPTVLPPLTEQNHTTGYDGTITQQLNFTICHLEFINIFEQQCHLVS